MRLRGTRSRWWAVCTTNRPASIGRSPSWLALTQSRGVVVSNARLLAASGPAASAISARTAVSFGRSRKWMATVQRPGPSSLAPATAASGSKLSATTSITRRAVASSVASCATVVALSRSDDINVPAAQRLLYTAGFPWSHRSSSSDQHFIDSVHRGAVHAERGGAAAPRGLVSSGMGLIVGGPVGGIDDTDSVHSIHSLAHNLGA